MAYLKVYDGNSWIVKDIKTVKYFNGVSFTNGKIAYWDGTSWIYLQAVGTTATILYTNENPTIYGTVSSNLTTNRYLGGTNRGGGGTYSGVYSPYIGRGGDGGLTTIFNNPGYTNLYGGSGAYGGGGAGGQNTYTDTFNNGAGGAGGGVIIIDADEVNGGSISSIGGNGVTGSQIGGAGGGGGSINLFVKKWNGNTSLNVNGGSGAYARGQNGQVGSILLFRKNDNGTYSLMAAIENGGAITATRLDSMNLLPPTFGTDFTKAFDMTTVVPSIFDKYKGMNLTSADMTVKKGATNIVNDFTSMDFTGTNLTSANITNSIFTNTIFTNTNFTTFNAGNTALIKASVLTNVTISPNGAYSGKSYTGSYLPRIGRGGDGGYIRYFTNPGYQYYYGGGGVIGGGAGGGSPWGYGGAGGGVVIIDADEINGGSISAVGGNATVQAGAGGGGGTINIFTKKWSGTTTLNVNCGSGAAQYPYNAYNGQPGSILLWQKNNNGTFTLMAGIENGGAISQARLNTLNGVSSGAPAPFNGTNFSIAFASLTPEELATKKPKNIVITVNDNQNPVLTFDPIDSVTQFIVKVSLESDFSTSKDYLLSGTTYSYTFTDLFSNSLYYLKICSVVGTDSIWSDVQTFTTLNNYAINGESFVTTITMLPSITDGDAVKAVYSNLSISQGATLTPSNRCKGLYLTVLGTLTLDGTISMTARGANAVGQTLDLGYGYTIPATGASGGGRATAPSSSTFVKGNNGIAGINGQCGGGGSGSACGAPSGYNTISGAGSAGTSYSGGTGGGSAGRATNSFDARQDGQPNGGTGGYGAIYGDPNWSCAGGAGNPGGGGLNSYYIANGNTGTGGLIVMYVNNLIINGTGVIESNGSDGGSYNPHGGGGSGAGSITIFYKNLINNGTIRANGGLGGNNSSGGNGGAGSIRLIKL